MANQAQCIVDGNRPLMQTPSEMERFGVTIEFCNDCSSKTVNWTIVPDVQLVILAKVRRALKWLPDK
jgi:hypothetical protein